MVNIVKEESFELDVLNATGPYFVDFYADWCGPCKMMAPIVEQLSEEFAGKIKFGKCNIDENMNVAQKYRIMSIPTMVLFQDGKVAETMVGAVQKNELSEILKKY